MEALHPAAAEIQVIYRNVQRASDRPVIKSSQDAFQHLFKAFNPDTIGLQEEFLALYANRANQVLGVYRVGLGGLTGVVADPRMVLSVALRIAATGVIVAHNHPSGSLKPSLADQQLTKKIHEAAKYFDIQLLDHLIVSPCGESYLSFADEGMI